MKLKCQTQNVSFILDIVAVEMIEIHTEWFNRRWWSIPCRCRRWLLSIITFVRAAIAVAIHISRFSRWGRSTEYIWNKRMHDKSIDLPVGSQFHQCGDILPHFTIINSITCKIGATTSIIGLVESMLFARRSHLWHTTTWFITALFRELKHENNKWITNTTWARNWMSWDFTWSYGAVVRCHPIVLNSHRSWDAWMMKIYRSFLCNIKIKSIDFAHEISYFCLMWTFSLQMRLDALPAIICYIAHRAITATWRRFVVIIAFARIRWINGNFRWWWWIKASIIRAPLTIYIGVSFVIRWWSFHCPLCLFNPIRITRRCL